MTSITDTHCENHKLFSLKCLYVLFYNVCFSVEPVFLENNFSRKMQKCEKVYYLFNVIHIMSFK